jgi:hypothetical protein
VPFTFATTADRVKHFKISPFLPLWYDGSRAILILCNMILGAVKLHA